MIAKINKDENIILLNSYPYKDFIKDKLHGAKWKKEILAWEVPFSIYNIEELQKTNCEIEKTIMEKYLKKAKDINEATKEKFVQESIEIEPMPIKAKPYQHQVKGYNIACKLMNLFKKGEV